MSQFDTAIGHVLTLIQALLRDLYHQSIDASLPEDGQSHKYAGARRYSGGILSHDAYPRGSGDVLACYREHEAMGIRPFGEIIYSRQEQYLTTFHSQVLPLPWREVNLSESKPLRWGVLWDDGR